MAVSEQHLFFLEGDSRYGCERWSREQADPGLLVHSDRVIPRALAGERVPVGVEGKDDYTFLAEEVASHLHRSQSGALLARVFAPRHLGEDVIVGFFGVSRDDGNQALWDAFDKVERGAHAGDKTRRPAGPWVRLHIAFQPSGLNVSGWSVTKWAMATTWLGDFARATAWAWLDTFSRATPR